jgi:hypothetical protein
MLWFLWMELHTLHGNAKGHIEHPPEGSHVHSKAVDGPNYLLVRIRNVRLDEKIRRDDGTEPRDIAPV